MPRYSFGTTLDLSSLIIKKEDPSFPPNPPSLRPPRNYIVFRCEVDTPTGWDEKQEKAFTTAMNRALAEFRQHFYDFLKE